MSAHDNSCHGKKCHGHKCAHDNSCHNKIVTDINIYGSVHDRECHFNLPMYAILYVIDINVHGDIGKNHG